MRQTPEPGRRMIPLPFDWPAYREYARSFSTARMAVTIAVIVVGGVVGLLVISDATGKIMWGILVAVGGALSVVPALVARRGMRD